MLTWALFAVLVVFVATGVALGLRALQALEPPLRPLGIPELEDADLLLVSAVRQMRTAQYDVRRLRLRGAVEKLARADQLEQRVRPRMELVAARVDSPRSRRVARFLRQYDRARERLAGVAERRLCRATGGAVGSTLRETLVWLGEQRMASFPSRAVRAGLVVATCASSPDAGMRWVVLLVGLPFILGERLARGLGVVMLAFLAFAHLLTSWWPTPLLLFAGLSVWTAARGIAHRSTHVLVDR